MKSINGLDPGQIDLAGAILFAMQPEEEQYKQIRAGIVDVVGHISPEQVQAGIDIFYTSRAGGFRTLDPSNVENGKQWYIRIALQTV